MQVLIVEDDDSVAGFLRRAVTQEGYAVQTVRDGFEALSMAGSVQFDLIFLDVGIPGMDGFEICRRLRKLSVYAPILMVTGESSTSDKIKGLDCGADDYIVKPFDVCELLARARALLRRGKSSPAVLRVGDLELDPATRCARRVERAILLSAREYALLEYFMRNPGRVLTRAMILSHVWDIDYDGSDNVLDVYVSYLRAKIGRDYLHTVRGVGYRLEAAD